MRRIAPALLLCAALTGCLGKTPPVEEYLSVGASVSDCQSLDPAGGPQRVVLGVKPVKALDSLERQAVLLGKGRVFSPSQRWYWEATPGQMVGQAVVAGLHCSKSIAPLWPVRAGSTAQRMLTADVSAFSVDTEAKRLTIAVQFQVWDATGKTLLAARGFDVSESVSHMEPQAVAQAGAQALAKLSGEVRNWLESVAVAPAKAGGK